MDENLLVPDFGEKYHFWGILNKKIVHQCADFLDLNHAP